MVTNRKRCGKWSIMVNFWRFSANLYLCLGSGDVLIFHDHVDHVDDDV